MKKIFTVLILIPLIFLGTKIGTQATKSITHHATITPVPSSVSVATPTTHNNQTQKVSIPQTLKISKINVDAKIESVGLDSQKRMDVPKDSDNVGWYNLGPKPGEKGPAVIAGHKDKVTGAPSVFWDLKKLTTGDKIIVTDEEGKEHVYAVVKTEEYPDDSFPLQKVFNSPTNESLLNLITCEGVWNNVTKNYSKRIVVFAELEK